MNEVLNKLIVLCLGVFDAVTLMVKEPDGVIRPEYEWSRGGMLVERLILVFV